MTEVFDTHTIEFSANLSDVSWVKLIYNSLDNIFTDENEIFHKQLNRARNNLVANLEKGQSIEKMLKRLNYLIRPRLFEVNDDLKPQLAGATVTGLLVAGEDYKTDAFNLIDFTLGEDGLGGNYFGLPDGTKYRLPKLKGFVIHVIKNITVRQLDPKTVMFAVDTWSKPEGVVSQDAAND